MTTQPAVETDCLNACDGQQCALGPDHGGRSHMGADGRSWPMHIPWNPIEGYQPKPLNISPTAPSEKID